MNNFLNSELGQQGLAEINAEEEVAIRDFRENQLRFAAEPTNVVDEMMENDAMDGNEHQPQTVRPKGNDVLNRSLMLTISNNAIKKWHIFYTLKFSNN